MFKHSLDRADLRCSVSPGRASGLKERAESLRMLPTFLGLGSGRCASTWLHQTLQLHPQILLTSHKEINFFGKYCIVQSLRDYENTLRPTSDKPNPLVRGDISPRYAWLSRQGIVAAHRLLPE